VTGVSPEAFCTSWLLVGIDASGSVGPNSSLLAMGSQDADLVILAPHVRDINLGDGTVNHEFIPVKAQLQ